MLKVSLNVQLYDRHGEPTNDQNLNELIEHHDFEDEYLNEHFKWGNKLIEKVSIVSVGNNNIVIHIKHNDNLDDLRKYLDNFIENDAPYHDYLTLFYQDDDGYQCSLSILSYDQ